MEKPLSSGRNDLYKFIERGELEGILVKGRLLESDTHDTEGIKETGKHIHWYRKILVDYNPKKKTVLLSKKGSKRLLDNLDIPDKEFTIDELYDKSWKIRPADYDIF